MSKKLLLTFIVALVLIGGGIYWAVSSSPTADPLTSISGSGVTSGTTSSSQGSTQPAEVVPETSTSLAPTITGAASQPTPSPKPIAPAPEPAPKPVAPPTGPKSYTMAEVAKHASQSDCWSAINGGVYNLTSWIEQHPGGSDAIISLCGKDGSSAFNDQHGGERRPANELSGFKIGIVAQ